MSKKTTCENVIYLDNNATTRVCDDAKRVMTDWIQSCSNASGSSFLSRASKILIDKAVTHVTRLCRLGKAYTVLFTSGASESNCSLLHMTVDAWWHNVGTKPHIITTSIEHKSILECLDTLAEQGRVDVTYVEPNIYGVVDPDAFRDAFRPETALVTVMFANNETGSINPVREIATLAHEHNVPFHTDAVQIFGKIAIDIPAMGIDALSMSFHKLYGPPGVGLLILRNTFIDGYQLRAQISGSQQHGLRGGTENTPAIAGAVAAMAWNFEGRRAKNKRLHALREFAIKRLAQRLPLRDYATLVVAAPESETHSGDDADVESGASDSNESTRLSQADSTGGKPKTAKPAKPADTKDKTVKRGAFHGKAFVVLGPPRENVDAYLPNTLLISVLDYEQPFCNVKFKHELERRGIIVSIGSACNTKSAKASHVIEAIHAPPIVKRGVLRISFSDYNTRDEVARAVDAMLDAIVKK